MARKIHTPVIVANWARGTGISSDARKTWGAEIASARLTGHGDQQRFEIKLLKGDGREMSLYLTLDAAEALANDIAGKPPDSI